MICDLPEHEIVRVCASVLPGEEKSARLKDICGPGVDWGTVFAAAKEHGVLFLLYKALKAHGSGVPGDFLQQAKQLYLQNSADNLRVSARLVRILGVLADAGVDAVPFKGPVQAEAVYNDIGARYFCDLDILVRRADVEAARDVLVKNGFSMDVPIAEDQVATYLRQENFFSFTDRAKSLHIDLHWELTGRYLLCPVYMEDLAGRLETVRLGGSDVTVLGAEDRLMYLCVHSSSHCWENLESVCAVAQMLSAGKITDWDELERRAARFGGRKMVYLGLMLARDVLGADLPGEVEKRIARRKFLVRLEKQAVKRFFNERGAGAEGLSWRFSPMHFLIRDSFADAVRYAGRMFFTPTIREWIDYPLPSRWLFLYRVLRPWRIVSGWAVSRLSAGDAVRTTFFRCRLFMKKRRAAGAGGFSAMVMHLPMRIMQKAWASLSEFINVQVCDRVINQRRFRQFQKRYRPLIGNHYYIIAMPHCLEVLFPCLDLLPEDVSFFLISNGLSQKAQAEIKTRYARLPVFDLKLLPGSSLPHGRVIDLLLENNHEKFGIMDYDLYVYNQKLFENIQVGEKEFAAGVFALENKKAGLVFPTTHLMFFNTPVIRQIMKDYKIGAREYKRIPMRLKKKLLSINLGYHNFLKDYLYYFDTLNLVMAMAFYKNYRARIITVTKKDCRHLGARQGSFTDKHGNAQAKTR